MQKETAGTEPRGVRLTLPTGPGLALRLMWGALVLKLTHPLH